MVNKELDIPVDGVLLKGDLNVPERATGIVIFSHGRGSGRFSPRNQKVSEALGKNGFGTLLFDLLTSSENQDYELHSDMDLLTSRLRKVTGWIKYRKEYSTLLIGYFGASTGAAIALGAAAALGPSIVSAVVSRGGRPDLVEDMLGAVQSPTLLLVGELDPMVLRLNRQAYEKLDCIKSLAIIPGASHLFEEPGKLERVAQHANSWFLNHLARNKNAKNIIVGS